ncbi:DUF4982 domain-containing protein [candidate division KSB1 bacterium]|nr:DUF4982 domain-containing protein [candidate division KSB1 bacterium]
MKIRTITSLIVIIMISSLFTSFLHAEKGSRIVVPVNKDWKFTKAPNSLDDLSLATWEEVSIPHTWNAVDMQMGKDFYQGDAYYEKMLFAPTEWAKKRIFIRFEGVGQVADLYINDRYLGQHQGSYSAFVFELTYDLKLRHENKLLVKVNNQSRPDIIPVNHFLFGIYGGIYRPVSLIVTDKLNITTTDDASAGIYIRQKNVSAQSAEIQVTTKIENRYKSTQNVMIKTSIYDDKGNLVQSQNDPIKVTPHGRQAFVQRLEMEKPHLWHGKIDPYLYKLVVTLHDEQGKIIDEVTQTLGVRKFEMVAGDGFYLNDEKYPLHGVCRHQDWWGYGNALSNKQHETDLAIIEEMGATTIRFAHYQQAEYIYAKCDSMGFIIWAEVPFVRTTTGKEAANAKQQITELVKQNFNHPSIYTWGLHNEVYCETPADYPAVVTREINEIAKTIDPDRYTVSVSGYGTVERPINLNADIQGMNRYYGWYEGKTPDLLGWIEGLETNYPDYKILLTEYGAEGNIDQQIEDVPESIPYNDQFFPESYETRCHEIQWGIIEKHPYILASYLWTMFDFAVPMWSRGGVPARNMKGIVTFDRKRKKDVFYWYKANWNPVAMVYITDRRVNERTHEVTTVNVYCNTGNVKLFVNEKEVTTVNAGATRVHFVFENVKLKPGKNIIKAKAESSGKKIIDEIEWFLKE